VVAGGHRTVDPGEDAYSVVVAPKAIHLGMFAAIHNSLKVIQQILEMPIYMLKPIKSYIPFLEMTMESCQGKCWYLTNKACMDYKKAGARFHEMTS